MRHAEKLTPVAAFVSALVTLACCFPVGFATAAALGSIGAVIAPLRPWLIGASVVLLVVSVLQVSRHQRICAAEGRTPWAAVGILVAASIIVLLVTLFPQIIAGMLADWMP